MRLAAATACLLLPGALLARALRVRLFSAVLAWSLAALFVAMTVVFAVHSSLTLALVLLAVIGAAALVVAARRADPVGDRALAGSVPRDRGRSRRHRLRDRRSGSSPTHLTGGDDFFHLARVRKLDDFGGLSLRAVDEFKDGGLHPGYAFPLWHSFLALVARLAGVDPSQVVLHEASILVPVAFLVAWEAGKEVFRSAWGASRSCSPRWRCSGSRPARRLVHGARAAGDREPPAARTGGDRPVLRVRRRALVGRARHARGRSRRARARPSDVRALPARPARRLRRRARRARPEGGRRGPGRRRRRPAPRGGRRTMGAPDRARDRLGEPVRHRAQPCARALQGSARRLLGRQLSARSRGGRPCGCGGGARPLRSAARRVRRQAPLGGSRDRRFPRSARPHAAPDPVHALRGRRVDLSGPESGGLRPVPVRGRRRSRRARPAAVPRCAARRARSGHRLPARLPGGLRVRAPRTAGPPSRRGSHCSAARRRSCSASCCRAATRGSTARARSRRRRLRLRSCPSSCTASRTGTSGRPLRTG